jgi:predicted metal-dependent phosphotriesterase family hydrolase
MSRILRTVLGDIDPASMGITYAHEHVIIDGGRPVKMQPEFDLGDVDAMATEVGEAAALGLRTVIDAMPCDAGRNVVKLAELSRRTGVNIVAPTGLHHDRYYEAPHWSHRVTVEQLADLFTADITQGVDGYDYSGPVVDRTPHRAGVIKVAGSADGLSDRDRRVFEAAAIAHRRTGAPILTHCEHGTGGVEQIRFLGDHGVPADRIALSHVDRVVDRGYHRELLGTGAYAEYDQSFRWSSMVSVSVPIWFGMTDPGPRPGENGTIRLLTWMLEDGLADRIVLGMDAARRRYLRVFGGRPGLTWLLEGFQELARGSGVPAETLQACLTDNPARVFAFEPVNP